MVGCVSASPPFDPDYGLDDKYTRDAGRVYITGVQALVRLPLMQRRRDRAAGLDTRGFISGYRGSPLGTYDLALWQARDRLEAEGVRFEPGLNEDLAATAVWGTQQANLYPGARHDGVFGIWYGKGPGVDRSCDALKHANYAGTSPRGGVLALAGDDPGAKSSSIAHQSEQAFIHCGIPFLNPASVQDYLDFGLYGWALSRYAGCWVGFKCLTDTVESSSSVSVGPERVRIVIPDDFERPENLHIGWSNLPVQVEARLYQQRLPAAQAFVRANGLDRIALDAPERRLGIVTTGKAYLDVRQALDELGIDETRAAELGLSLYKIAMPWPLEPERARAFAEGLEDVLVIEEKRPVIEEQLARQLFNRTDRPRLLGKLDEHGAPLVPNDGELTPARVTALIRHWLERRGLGDGLRTISLPQAPAGAPSLLRLPAFCSGCPHNTSTVVPEGSLAQGGIGCHGMAVWLPGRNTLAVTHMGGEGANWIGSAPFTDTPHIFQNMGDGTYFHSGLLAIRASVAAGVNVTYKVLANGAVAMTGGQPIEGERMEGEVTVPEIARQLAAEGVSRIAIVSNEPDKYPANAGFPPEATIHHRDAIDRVQRELREHAGVSALVYDQTCAAEARRLRKRGQFPDPDRRILINELVCEGCGDCSVQSNCISIEPVETELGRKRRINQSSCNKDYSCLRGYCPSFVSVIGGRPRRAPAGADTGDADLFRDLPEPALPDLSRPFEVLVTGIGGSGVITLGALLGMAAHLEGRGCSVLDVTGLAQKNGPVASHVRIAADPEALHATRIAAAAADVVLGCDIVVTTSPDNLGKISKGRTTPIVNDHLAPTSDFASNPDLDLSTRGMADALRQAAGDDACAFVPATRLATALMGDAIFTNPFLLGYALQRGRLPVGLGALERAIELNGRAVDENKRALAWGRLAALDRDAVEAAARPGLRASEAAGVASSLEEIVARRVDFLTGYQDAAYARRYATLVERVAARERERCGEGTHLAEAVARYYFKLLAYKDEYEVARLFTDGRFRGQLEAEFEGDYRLKIHLSPQFIPHWIPHWLGGRDPDTGRARKFAFGAWMLGVLGVLRHFKFLRGTPFDVVGWTAHRRLERRLIREYEATLEEILDGLNDENRDLAVEIASLPEHVRGFDSVKESQLAEANVKRTELLEAYRRRA
jgi:indolepyruvate ferredoxin oxidoreductase